MSRMLEVKSGVEQWNQWRADGHAPKTRDAALRIISKHMGLDFSKVRDRLARGVRDVEGTEKDIDSRLSFIVWDIEENEGALFDYTRTLDRILSDLLTEAGNLIRQYTRYKLPTGRITEHATKEIRQVAERHGKHVLKSPTITAPAYLTVDKKIVNVRDISNSKLDELADQFIALAVRSMLRWRAFGADASYFKRVLARIEEKVADAIAA